MGDAVLKQSRKLILALFYLILTVGLSLSALLMPGLGVLAASAEGGLLKVTVLDVGQGDSILIRTPGGKNILIDGGDDRNNWADNVILPFLRQNGITTLDQVILTHAHRDHVGGLLTVLEKVKVLEVIENRASTTQMYLEFLKIVKKNNIKLTKAYRGDKLDWGPGINAEVLHPSKGWEAPGWVPGAGKAAPTTLGTDTNENPTGDPNLNEYSVVVRAEYGKVSYYFAGDCEKEGEKDILANYSDAKLKCNIYKAAHHGSDTSSTPAILAKIKPEVAVISVGEGNSFGHPCQSTLDHLAYYCKSVYRTDKDKTIDTWTDGTTYHVSTGATPNELMAGPEVRGITATGATVFWQTSQLATSIVNYGVSSVTENHVASTSEFEMAHNVTLENLKPDTTYKFQIVSKDKRNPDQVITKDATFKTAAAPAEQITITGITFKPATPTLFEPLNILATIKRDAPETFSLRDGKVCFYFDAVSPSKLICSVDISADAQFTATATWTPQESRPTTIFVTVEKGGKVLAQASKPLAVTRRKVVLDAGHKSHIAGELQEMKIDLSTHGYDAAISEGTITKPLLTDVNVLVIPEPGTGSVDLSATELTTVKEFVDAGGGVLVSTRCDYGGRSNSEGVNRLLKKLGANIRVNDDEVKDDTSNAGCPWFLNVSTFPSNAIKDVQILLSQSSASLLDANMKPLTATGKVILFATGDTDTYNIDSDGANDAVIYPKGTKVALDAGEVLPKGGKIAVFGAGHMSSNYYYYTSKHQTPIYNYCVVRWLALGSAKDSGELVENLRDLSRVDSPARALEQIVRYDDSKKELLERLDPLAPEFDKNLFSLVESLSDPEAREQLVPVARETLQRLRFLSLQDPALGEKFRPSLDKLENALGN
jgi:competence protein ComEC